MILIMIYIGYLSQGMMLQMQKSPISCHINIDYTVLKINIINLYLISRQEQ